MNAGRIQDFGYSRSITTVCAVIRASKVTVLSSFQKSCGLHVHAFAFKGRDAGDDKGYSKQGLGDKHRTKEKDGKNKDCKHFLFLYAF